MARFPLSYGPEWPGLREQVFARDGKRCHICERPKSRRLRLEVHHVVPYAQAGKHELTNLRPLCRRCHRAVHLAYGQRACLSHADYQKVYAWVRRRVQEKQAALEGVRAAKKRKPGS